MAERSHLDTVAGRLLLTAVLPSLLAVAALVTLGAMHSWSQMRASSEALLRSKARSTGELLTAESRRLSLTAELLSDGQRSGLFGRRADSIEMLRDLLEDNKADMYGVYVAYEPNADGNDRKPTDADRIPQAALGEGGRFIPYIYLEDVNAGRIGIKPLTGMETDEWYNAPKEAFERTHTRQTIVTEPYLYEGTMMVTHVRPIVIDGEFAGNAGVDRSLDRLSADVLHLLDDLDADLFLLSRQGRFIIASSEVSADGTPLKLQAQSAADTAYAPIASRWMTARSGDVFEAEDPVLGEHCYYAVARAPGLDWTVVLRRTDSAVLAGAKMALWRAVGLGGFAILVIATLMYLAARSITRRLAVSVAAADRIAAGDLSTAVGEVRGRDETAQLVGAMRHMSRNLNDLLGAVKSATITLSSTSTEMAASAQRQQASASTFGSASSQIAAAVTEISATGDDLMRTMEGVATDAAESAGLATAGRTGLEEMESVMRDLDRATVSIGEKLAAINERSQKITSVVTTITKVADQTNILSINAAIEAEKAGEYGGGFLVIAREIRRLADQTAAATLDIEQMVQQMQSAVSTGVMEMDRFADQVRRGVHNVEAAVERLGEIIDRVNRSTQRFREVNESMQAQTAGAQQIREAMEHLTGNASQAMESIEQFGHAAEDLQQSIASLREAVSRFKLGA